MMNSAQHGADTSAPEVTNISSHGLWLLANGHECFLSYEDLPWFMDVSVSKITNVTEPFPGHFYWPDLDVDLGIDTIQQPEKFPLIDRE